MFWCVFDADGLLVRLAGLIFSCAWMVLIWWRCLVLLFLRWFGSGIIPRWENGWIFTPLFFMPVFLWFSFLVFSLLIWWRSFSVCTQRWFGGECLMSGLKENLVAALFRHQINLETESVLAVSYYFFHNFLLVFFDFSFDYLVIFFVVSITLSLYFTTSAMTIFSMARI